MAFLTNPSFLGACLGAFLTFEPILAESDAPKWR